MFRPACVCLPLVISFCSPALAVSYTYQGASESMIRGVFQSLLNGVGLWLVFALAVVALVVGSFWLVNRLSRDTGLAGDSYRSVVHSSAKHKAVGLAARAFFRR